MSGWCQVLCLHVLRMKCPTLHLNLPHRCKKTCRPTNHAGFQSILFWRDFFFVCVVLSSPYSPQLSISLSLWIKRNQSEEVREGTLEVKIRWGCLISTTARGPTVMSWINDFNKLPSEEPTRPWKHTSPCGIIWPWLEIRAILNVLWSCL